MTHSIAIPIVTKKALHSVQFSYISDKSDMNIDEIKALYELSRNHIKLNLSNLLLQVIISCYILEN